MPTWTTFAPFILVQAALTFHFGLSVSRNLYGKKDVGITSLEQEELTKAIVGSSKPWLIQFYASWCGHCQKFRPTFSKFGVQVQAWSDVIGIGVINCASTDNGPTCDLYGVTSYPTLRLFPPNASSKDEGEDLREHWTVMQLLKGTAEWLERQEGLPKLASNFENAPLLTGLRTGQPEELWSEGPQRLQKKAEEAVVIFSDNDLSDEFSVGEIIMDVFAVTKNTEEQLIVRKVEDKEVASSLIAKLGVEKTDPLPLLVAVGKVSSTKAQVILTREVAFPKDATYDGQDVKNMMKNAIYDWFQKIHPSLSLKSLDKNLVGGDKATVPPAKTAKAVTDEKEIKRRRYTAYLLDIELALEYALTQEIGRGREIRNDELTAARDFLAILVKHFPGSVKRPGTQQLLEHLQHWLSEQHEVVHGKAFSDQVKELKSKLGAFAHSQESFIGCKGSSSQYGNYPCGLWTLWHYLTINQMKAAAVGQGDGDGKDVLLTMVKYMKYYFGCKECSQNFLKLSDHGKAITSHVNSVDEAVVWLWNAHNNVNQRLSGDLTDDPAFPKKIFPQPEHCSQCYYKDVSGNKVDLVALRSFLVELYHTKLNTDGLIAAAAAAKDTEDEKTHPDVKAKSPSSEEPPSKDLTPTSKVLPDFFTVQKVSFANSHLLLFLLVVVVIAPLTCLCVRVGPRLCFACARWMTERQDYNRFQGKMA